MWFQHLQTVQDNRKRGASKAAKTRGERGLNKKTENQNTEASYFIVSAVLDSFEIGSICFSIVTSLKIMACE